MEHLAAFGTSIFPSLAPTFQAYDRLLAPLLLSESGFDTPREARYGPFERQVVDVYLPSASGASASGARADSEAGAREGGEDGAPVLIFVHGGGLTRGDKRLPFPRGAHQNVGTFFARRGFLTLIPNYRLVDPESGSRAEDKEEHRDRNQDQRAKFPSGAEDLETLLRWLEHQFQGTSSSTSTSAGSSPSALSSFLDSNPNSNAAEPHSSSSSAASSASSPLPLPLPLNSTSTSTNTSTKFEFDPSRVFLLGNSAGAVHVATWLWLFHPSPLFGGPRSRREMQREEGARGEAEAERGGLVDRQGEGEGGAAEIEGATTTATSSSSTTAELEPEPERANSEPEPDHVQRSLPAPLPLPHPLPLPLPLQAPGLSLPLHAAAPPAPLQPQLQPQPRVQVTVTVRAAVVVSMPADFLAVTASPEGAGGGPNSRKGTLRAYYASSGSGSGERRGARTSKSSEGEDEDEARNKGEGEGEGGEGEAWQRVVERRCPVGLVRAAGARERERVRRANEGRDEGEGAEGRGRGAGRGEGTLAAPRLLLCEAELDPSDEILLPMARFRSALQDSQPEYAYEYDDLWIKGHNHLSTVLGLGLGGDEDQWGREVVDWLRLQG